MTTAELTQARALRAQGMSYVRVGKTLHYCGSTIRYHLSDGRNVFVEAAREREGTALRLCTSGLARKEVAARLGYTGIMGVSRAIVRYRRATEPTRPRRIDACRQNMAEAARLKAAGVHIDTIVTQLGYAQRDCAYNAIRRYKLAAAS